MFFYVTWWQQLRVHAKVHIATLACKILEKCDVTTCQGAHCGHIPDAIAHRLEKNPVAEIYSTEEAFAAVLKSHDGSIEIVTWGNPEKGGDCSTIPESLRWKVLEPVTVTNEDSEE